VESFYYTLYRLKLAPILYEKHSDNTWDIYLYMLWTFGLTPDEVDNLPAEFVGYIMAKKLQRGW
jgi:Na+/H+ antiporter NhaD/arsenite permease-like protein